MECRRIMDKGTVMSRNLRKKYISLELDEYYRDVESVLQYTVETARVNVVYRELYCKIYEIREFYWEADTTLKIYYEVGDVDDYDNAIEY